MDWLEIVAVVFGLACVSLTVRQNIWCWPTGLVMVSLYIVIFWRVKLYSDMGLQVIYVVLQIYGWWHWLHGDGRPKEGEQIPVERLSPPAMAGWVIVSLVGTASLGFVMGTYTDAALPYWDAATTTLSLVAQYLMARKSLENWLFWIAVDTLAIGIYAVKGLALTAGLYAVFLGLCVAGWIAWKRSYEGRVATDEPIAA